MAVAFLVAATLATLAVLVAVPYPFEARIAGFILVPGLALLWHRRLAAVRELRVDCERAIAVRDARGWRGGTVRDGCFVAPWLTIVLWRPEDAWMDRALVILPDMLDAESFRRIRVILRWG